MLVGCVLAVSVVLGESWLIPVISGLSSSLRRRVELVALDPCVQAEMGLKRLQFLRDPGGEAESGVFSGQTSAVGVKLEKVLVEISGKLEKVVALIFHDFDVPEEDYLGDLGGMGVPLGIVEHPELRSSLAPLSYGRLWSVTWTDQVRPKRHGREEGRK